MDDIQICRAASADQPELHRLWQDVFGDPTELILSFFHRFPPEVAAWTVRSENAILSAAYLIPGNWYMNGTEIRPAAYVYAVATPKAMRGMGYAGMLMKALKKEAQARELLLYTRPAEASLFPWYARTMETEHAGRMTERAILRNMETAPLPLRQITPEEYGALREQKLQSLPHIVLSDRFLQLQEIYSNGYFAVGDSLCCCAVQDGSVRMLEYLGSDGALEAAAQNVMKHFEKDEAILRKEERDGVLSSVAYCGEKLPDTTHWGLFLE